MANRIAKSILYGAPFFILWGAPNINAKGYDMGNPQFLDLQIIKHKRKFYVIITDADEQHKVGPFSKKHQAQKVFNFLAKKAAALGGAQMPVCPKSLKSKAA